MHIRKDDNVIVIAGKDRGKTGKITRAFPRGNMILIQGLNMVKKHERPRRRGKKGEIVTKSIPIHVSNVMLIDPKTGKRTRIGAKVIGGKKVRVTRKSNSELK